MSSPTKGTRRLSNAFDNFRNKVRRNRIDSLLSPPKPDSGESSSGSEWEGIPLTSTETMDMALTLPELNTEQVHFTLPSQFETGIESNVESLDENRRVTAALGDFSAECTEPEEFERLLAEQRMKKQSVGVGKQQQKYDEEHVSPTGSMDTGVSSPDSASIRTASTMDYEIGVPLERTFAREIMHFQTQVQTEPQTAEQTRLQSTFVSLDQMVNDAGWMVQERERPKQTVDGLRLDARPLLRHSGISAPPHSQLHIDGLRDRGKQRVEQDVDTRGYFEGFDAKIPTSNVSGIRSTLDAPVAVAGPSAHSLQQSNVVSTVSSSADVTRGYPDWRNIGNTLPLNIPFHQQRNLVSSTFGLDGGEDADSGVSPQSSGSNVALTMPIHRVRRNAFGPWQSHARPQHSAFSNTFLPATQQPRRMGEYSHTPPRFQPHAILANYTALHTNYQIRLFHEDLVQRLKKCIQTGGVRASQIPVKERVRRMSGTRMAQGVRRMGRDFGDAVVGSGAVGVGWRHVSVDAERDERVGERAGLVYYGAGFV